MILDIGKLKHRFSILRNSSFIDDNKISREVECLLFSDWCSVNNIKHSDKFKDNCYIKESEIVFFVRFNSNIFLSDKILFDNRKFKIISIDDIEHKLLKISAKEEI